MAHSGLDRRQIELGVLVGRELDASVFLQTSLDNDVIDVSLRDGFSHRGQPVA